MSEQTIAQRSAPPSEPANRWFLRPKAIGRMARQVTAYCTTQLRRSTPDLLFDGIEFADPAQGLGRDRGAGRLMHLEELPPRMCPAGREHNALRDQLLEPWIAIDLQGALKPFE